MVGIDSCFERMTKCLGEKSGASFIVGGNGVSERQGAAQNVFYRNGVAISAKPGAASIEEQEQLARMPEANIATMLGGGGVSEGDDDEEIGSEDVDGEEGVQFHPDQDLIRKVGDDGGQGGLSSEGAGEDAENRRMGSESGAGAKTDSAAADGGEGFGGGARNDAGGNPQNSGTEGAQAQLGQLNTNPAQAQMGQAIDGGWPDQMQDGQDPPMAEDDETDAPEAGQPGADGFGSNGS